jgi:Holliday junction resolvase RusA-like endonuclease
MRFTIPVKPRTKKNHMQLVTLKTGRQMMLPSKAYKEFEKQVLNYVAENPLIIKSTEEFKLPIEEKINLKGLFYKEKDYKSDLAGYLQALQDALVKAGVIKDDNHKIIETTDGSRVFLDRDNPRIEVEITKISV